MACTICNHSSRRAHTHARTLRIVVGAFLPSCFPFSSWRSKHMNTHATHYVPLQGSNATHAHSLIERTKKTFCMHGASCGRGGSRTGTQCSMARCRRVLGGLWLCACDGVRCVSAINEIEKKWRRRWWWEISIIANVHAHTHMTFALEHQIQ